MVVGDIDEQMPRAEIVRHPAPPLQIQLDLADPIVDRHVHRRQRRGDPRCRWRARACRSWNACTAFSSSLEYSGEVLDAAAPLKCPPAANRCRSAMTEGLARPGSELSSSWNRRPTTFVALPLQFDQRVLQRGIFGMLRADGVEPFVEIAAGRVSERADEIRRFATARPLPINRPGRRAANGDIAAERQKRGRQTRIELGQLLRALRRVVLQLASEHGFGRRSQPRRSPPARSHVASPSARRPMP